MPDVELPEVNTNCNPNVNSVPVIPGGKANLYHIPGSAFVIDPPEYAVPKYVGVILTLMEELVVIHTYASFLVCAEPPKVKAVVCEDSDANESITTLSHVNAPAKTPKSFPLLDSVGV